MLPTGSTSIVILPSSEIYWGWEACSVEAGLSWDWFYSCPWSNSRWSFAHRNTHLWSRRLYIHGDNKSTVCRKNRCSQNKPCSCFNDLSSNLQQWRDPSSALWWLDTGTHLGPLNRSAPSSEPQLSSWDDREGPQTLRNQHAAVQYDW